MWTFALIDIERWVSLKATLHNLATHEYQEPKIFRGFEFYSMNIAGCPGIAIPARPFGS